MAKGNKIVVSANPGGRFIEGFVGLGETYLPGILVQTNPAIAQIGKRFTYKLYTRVADGDRPKGPPVIVIENQYLGKLATDSTGYAAGERFFGYIPVVGDELNLLCKNVSGTADDIVLDTCVCPDTGTGKWQATTGSPQWEPAQALEAVTDPTADTLFWAYWSGT